MARKKVYLASPYGFSEQQRQLLLPLLVSELEKCNVDVHEPFAAADTLDFEQKGWAYECANLCLKGVRECDAVFAVINGTPPDEGVMVELGYAMALGKSIFLFRDDFRKCSDSEEYPLNLMVFASLPKDSWEQFYYTSVEQIGAPGRALMQWAGNA